MPPQKEDDAVVQLLESGTSFVSKAGWLTDLDKVSVMTQIVKGLIWVCPPAWYCAWKWGRSPYLGAATKVLQRLTGLQASVEDALFNINPPCTELYVSGTVEGTQLWNPSEYTASIGGLEEGVDAEMAAVQIPWLRFEMRKGWDDIAKRARLDLIVEASQGLTIIFDTKNLLFTETNFSAITDKLSRSYTGRKMQQRQKRRASQNGQPSSPQQQVVLTGLAIRGNTILKVVKDGKQIFDDIYILELELDPETLSSPYLLMNYLKDRALQEIAKNMGVGPLAAALNMVSMPQPP